MSSMRDELEQRRDGMWTGAYVAILLVIPALYGAVLAPGVVLQCTVAGLAMVLAVAGYALALSAKRLEEVLYESTPPTAAEPAPTTPPEQDRNRPSGSAADGAA